MVNHAIDVGSKIVSLPDSFFANIMDVALEGGINYWADVVSHTSGENPAHNRADLLVDEGGTFPKRYTITIDTMVNGVQRMIGNKPVNESKSKYIATYYQMHTWLMEACLDPEDGIVMVDADVADAVVQFGLFEEQVFG